MGRCVLPPILTRRRVMTGLRDNPTIPIRVFAVVIAIVTVKLGPVMPAVRIGIRRAIPIPIQVIILILSVTAIKPRIATVSTISEAHGKSPYFSTSR